MGKDQELDLLRNQKDLLNEELTEQSSAIQDLIQKFKEKSDIIIQLESKIQRLRSKIESRESDYESDSESDDDSTLSIQEEMKSLVDQLEYNRQKYQSLKFEKQQMKSTITELEKNVHNYQEKIEELEMRITKLTLEVKDKEKELNNVKVSLKEKSSSTANNPKFFKALAEELQSEKTKALKLSSQLTKLQQELKDKSQIIEEMSKSQSSDSDSRYQNLVDELNHERLRTSQLSQELDSLRSVIIKNPDSVSNKLKSQTAPSINNSPYNSTPLSRTYPILEIAEESENHKHNGYNTIDLSVSSNQILPDYDTDQLYN